MQWTPGDHRIRDMLEHMNLNWEREDGESWIEEDAVNALANECGLQGNGHCTLAGSEYCEWECPFS